VQAPREVSIEGWELIDGQGRMLKAGSDDASVISLKAVDAGIYFLRLRTNAGDETVRIFVRR